MEAIGSRFFRLFWGPLSPLSSLAGLGLLIMASGRTGFALVTLGALLWVYILTALALSFSWNVLPRRGTWFVIFCVSSVLAGLYLLILYLLNPFLAVETSLYIILVPVVCHMSALPERIGAMEWREGTIQAFVEALAFGAFLIALALIREILGLGAITLPGGGEGLLVLSLNRDFSLIPADVLDSSAGAFLLLGYGTAFFRRFREKQGGISGEKRGEKR